MSKLILSAPLGWMRRVWIQRARRRVGAIVAQGTFAASFGTHAPPAQGVVVQGLVIQEGTRSPINRALVTHQQTDIGEVFVVRTDSAGRFRFQIDRSVPVVVFARKIGFQSRSVTPPVCWSGDSLVVALPSIASLPAVEIATSVGAQRQLEQVGFVGRRKVGFGHFLDSADVARRAPTSTLSLLHGYIKGCTMIFVYGIRLLPLGDVDPETIVGVEIYESNIEAPPQFRNPIDGARCGSIVVWRRF